jgi:hypothetical protein
MSTDAPMPSTKCGSPSRRSARVRLVARLMMLLLIVASVAQPNRSSRAADRPKLYVFLLTGIKSGVLEAALQAKLPGLTVTVFSRFRDFQEAMTAKRPEAVLAFQPALDAQKTPPVLRGLNKGQDFEKFVLLSAGAPLQGSLSNRTIGVVDLLGRAETQSFVAKLLKTPDVHTKLVTKLDDLLPLLQFSASDAVLVPASAVGGFKERSQMSLHVRETEDARVGRVALGVLVPAASAAVVSQIQALDAATKQMIGVDSWGSQ